MKPMSRILFVVLLLCVLPAGLMAQSKSYETLKSQFKGMDEVHSFAVGSFFVRMALNFVDDEDFDSDAIESIGKIHLMTIPKQHFENQKLTLHGFEKYVLARDGYETLLSVRERDDNVRVFMQPGNNRDNRYLFLIDDENEVVAIEFNGYVNPDKLFNGHHKLTYEKL
jgi:hypothetical protein